METKRLEYFCCFNSYANKTAKLSDKELGRLFRALMKYNETGERQELDGRESIAFDFIADDIDRQHQKYKDKCDQNRANASGAGRNQQKSSGNSGNQPQANAGDHERTQANAGERPIYKYKTETEAEGEGVGKNTHSSSASADGAAEASAESGARVAEESAFDRFWAAYPKKTGKGAAKKAFNAAKRKTSLEVMLSAVERQKQSFQWNQNGGQYIPAPTRWLSEERWNDEISDFSPPGRNPPPFAPNHGASSPTYGGERPKTTREMMEERNARRNGGEGYAGH